MQGTEVSLVALVLTGEMSVSDFSGRIKDVLIDTNLCALLIDCVAEILRREEETCATSCSVMSSSTLSIFIAEMSVTAQSKALDQVRKALEHCPHIISWSNTNLSPSLYANVLAMAYKHNRAVRFLRWGQEIPRESLREMVLKNLVSRIAFLCAD